MVEYNGQEKEWETEHLQASTLSFEDEYAETVDRSFSGEPLDLAKLDNDSETKDWSYTLKYAVLAFVMVGTVIGLIVGLTNRNAGPQSRPTMVSFSLSDQRCGFAGVQIGTCWISCNSCFVVFPFFTRVQRPSNRRRCVPL